MRRTSTSVHENQDDMADNPSPHDNPIPEQLKRQMAEAEQIRADLAQPSEASPPQPAAEETPQPQPADSPPPSIAPPAEDEQSWEQRYRSLQGRFDTTQKSNQQMADRLTQMEQLIASMQARGHEPQRPEAAVPITKPKLVTEQEAADYGDEMLTVVGKRAREEFAPEFEELAARIKRIESQVQGVGQVIDTSQKMTVYQTLQQEIPDWKTINRSDEFKFWLGQPDTFSGRRRMDMLKEAFDRHEPGRVLAFFRGFLTEATGTPPEASSPGTSAPPLANGGNGSGKPSLEDFAAPGRARSAPQSMPPDKPVYSTAFIAKFMADKRTGKYRGREADAEAIERDIYQAQHEGRISP